MKKNLVILIVVAVVILGIGWLLYNKHVSSPEYSLAQIREAYEQHDITTFEKYVDVKGVVSGIMDKRFDEISKRSSATTEAELLGENLGKGLVNLMRPQMEELWAQQINKLVETGELTEDKKGIDELWNMNDSSSFKQIREVRKDGKVASISLEFNQPRFDTTLLLSVKMRDKGDYWQLFDISDIFNYGQTLDSLEESRVDELNEEVKKEFLQNVGINVTVKSQSNGNYYVYYTHFYNVDFVNRSNKIIDLITCVFEIYDARGNELETVYLFDQKVNLQPGEKYVHKVVDYYSHDKINARGISVGINRAEVNFNDGSQIRWHFKWEVIK